MSSAGLDIDAEAYLVATGLISDSVYTPLLNTAVMDKKAAGIYTRLYLWYPDYGTEAQQKFNVKNPLDTDAAFRATFNGSTAVYSTAGYQPNTGTNLGGYENTHFIPSANVTLNSECYWLYVSTNNTPTGSDPIDFGSYNTGTQSSYLTVRGTAAKDKIAGRLNATAISITNTDARGMYIINKNGNTTQRTLKNGALIGSLTSAGSLSTQKMYRGTLNFMGTALGNGYTNQVYAGFGAASGLTPTMETDLTNIQQAFNVAIGLGRNVTF